MRALACVALAAAALGCNAATPDPCKGIAGTCVTLTVQSSTVATVDSLHILASGALSGDQTSSGGRANLPVVVALQLPPNASGSLDLHVDAFLTATPVGSCDTDTLVTPGQHATAVCTLVGADNGGVDMSTGGGDDLAGTGPDMLTPPCDPKGMTGPQCQWRWQDPLPQGDVVNAIVAFDDANTFMLSEDNLVYHRDANAWSALAAAPTATGGLLSLATMFGGGTGMDLYIGGSLSGTSTTPLVFHSTDLGASWTQEALPAGAMGTVAQGASTGKAAILPATGGNVYQRDATSGVWTTRVASSASGVTLNATAMNSNGAVVVGGISTTTAVISYSINGGAAWTAVTTATISPSTQPLSGVCVGTNGGTNTYWAVGGAVILKGVGNSPTTWNQTGTAASAGKQLSGCVAADATHAWAFGTNGTILGTTDGTNWAVVGAPGPTTDWLHAGAHSLGTALFVGGENATSPYQGLLYRSTNGGTSFTNELAGGPTDKLDAVYGVAPSTLFAVGENGAIYKTSDGTAWSKIAASGSTAQVLSGVWAASATDVYAVGTGGTIVHSSDGMTFAKYNGANAPTSTTYFQDVWGSPAFGVFAVGYDMTGTTRVVYHSTDHGATWGPVTIAGFTGAAGEVMTTFALGNDVWVAGDNGNVYHSSDGVSFTMQNTGTTAAITRLRGVTGHMIALLGVDPGTYISTVNSGVTWTAPTTSPLNDSPQNMTITPDEGAIYVFGSFAGPIASFDKEATWNFVPTVMNPNATRAAFAYANNNVYIVGDSGIIHYGN